MTKDPAPPTGLAWQESPRTAFHVHALRKGVGMEGKKRPAGGFHEY